MAAKKSQIIDEYQLQEKISSGGQGEVWKVVNLKNSGTFAMKILDERGLDSSALKRFKRELTVLRGLDTQQFARIWKWDLDGPIKYIVQEFIAGRTVAEWVHQNEDVEYETVVQFARQIARGLTSLHSLEMAHRDLSSRNVIITDSHDFQVVVVDLGLVIDVDDSHTRFFGGTPGFIPSWDAPDRYMKRDLYNLGQLMACLGLSRSTPLGPVEMREHSPLLHPLLRTMIFALVSEDWRTIPDAEELLSWLDRINSVIQTRRTYEIEQTKLTSEYMNLLKSSQPHASEFVPDTNDDQIERLFSKLRRLIGVGKRNSVSELFVEHILSAQQFSKDLERSPLNIMDMLQVLDELREIGLSKIESSLARTFGETLPQKALSFRGFDSQIFIESPAILPDLESVKDVGTWLEIALDLSDPKEFATQILRSGGDKRPTTFFRSCGDVSYFPNYPLRLKSVLAHVARDHYLKRFAFSNLSKTQEVEGVATAREPYYYGVFLAYRVQLGLAILPDLDWMVTLIRGYLRNIEPADQTLFDLYLGALLDHEIGITSELTSEIILDRQKRALSHVSRFSRGSAGLNFGRWLLLLSEQELLPKNISVVTLFAPFTTEMISARDERIQHRIRNSVRVGDQEGLKHAEIANLIRYQRHSCYDVIKLLGLLTIFECESREV